MIEILIYPTFTSWQSAARELLQKEIPPSEIIWRERTAAQRSLFAPTPSSSSRPQSGPQDATEWRDLHSDHPIIKVPKSFLDLARRVSRHRDQRRWTLLYSVLWRILHQNRNLLSIRVDDEVSRLLRLHWEVGSDAHRMKALLRFRKVHEKDHDVYIAWYKPDHDVVPIVAPHFTDKFATMHWAILTPDCCAHWDTQELRFSPGVERARAPHDDELEDLWRAFYRSTFNPARLSPKTMRSEMPVRFWKNLPEADVIGSAICDAPKKVKDMIQKTKIGRNTTE